MIGKEEEKVVYQSINLMTSYQFDMLMETFIHKTHFALFYKIEDIIIFQFNSHISQYRPWRTWNMKTLCILD